MSSQPWRVQSSRLHHVRDRCLSILSKHSFRWLRRIKKKNESTLLLPVYKALIFECTLQSSFLGDRGVSITLEMDRFVEGREAFSNKQSAAHKPLCNCEKSKQRTNKKKKTVFTRRMVDKYCIHHTRHSTNVVRKAKEPDPWFHFSSFSRLNLPLPEGGALV